MDICAPPSSATWTRTTIVRSECLRRGMIELDLATFHGDTSPRIAGADSYYQRSVGGLVHVLEMIAEQAGRATAVHDCRPGEFIKRRVRDVEFTAIVFDPLVAIEQGPGLKADLLTRVLESLTAIQIHPAIRDRRVREMIQP